MESLSERNERKRYEEAKKKQKRKRIITIIVVILLVAGMVVYVIDSQINRDYNGYKVEKKFDRTDSNTVKYINYDGRLLKYSRDGISELDDSGNVVWTGSYDMKNPIVAYCGNFVAVADTSGKEIYVYNRTNSTDIKKIEVVLPIIEIDIAKQGVVAAVLEDTDSDEINIYDPYNISKQLLVSIPTTVETDGFPIDISISDDGEKVVTNYINISNGQAQTSVNFYNFDEIGKNSVNRIVGARDFKDTIVADVKFLNEQTVCAFTETGFSLYSMKEVPKDIYQETFQKPIKSVFSSEKYVGIVLENTGGEEGAEIETSKETPDTENVNEETDTNQDSSKEDKTNKNTENINKESQYEVKIYNLKGKQILDTNIDYDYDTVTMGRDEIIFQSNLECYIFRMNGTEKFHYTFDKNIEYLLETSAKEQYYMIDEKEISKIKLMMK